MPRSGCPAVQPWSGPQMPSSRTTPLPGKDFVRAPPRPAGSEAGCAAGAGLPAPQSCRAIHRPGVCLRRSFCHAHSLFRGGSDPVAGCPAAAIRRGPCLAGVGDPPKRRVVRSAARPHRDDLQRVGGSAARCPDRSGWHGARGDGGGGGRAGADHTAGRDHPAGHLRADLARCIGGRSSGGPPTVRRYSGFPM